MQEISATRGPRASNLNAVLGIEMRASANRSYQLESAQVPDTPSGSRQCANAPAAKLRLLSVQQQRQRESL
eukprot:160972-Amphidinium_carterae.1